MKSILSKVWLGITSLVLIILLIIWLFQVGLLNSFYINERSDILLKEGHKLSSILSSSKDFQSISQDVIQEIETFGPSYNARILIIDSYSNILFYNIPKHSFKGNKKSNDREIEAEEDFIKRNLSVFYNDVSIEQNISKGNTFTIVKSDTRFPERKAIIVGVPIERDKNTIGYALLNSPLAPIEEMISILKKQLSIITFGSLIIGTILALLFAKHFTKPIRQITNTAKKIAKGDFTANVALDSKDEIGDLGNTINNMSQQLGQIENFRRDFIANTTHELKTPISLIKAYAELVKDMDSKNTISTNEHLQVIIDESDRLNNMVEDILYLSKMESGYSKLKIESFQIVDVINSVIDKLSFFSSSKDISLVLEIDRKETLINGDKEKVHQVFYNIINNAINHSHSNGQVSIKVSDINDIIRVDITDNGKGIPSEDLPYIWGRFYKVDKSRTRDSSGTGLGMAIVKNILEAHNFSYGIESEIDNGTNVWFEIPRP
ncbi:ATP-binding protein [Wukongibacter sp. M2B1]|uniref:sensor histidine kinase n=1 Tax=Wukongibacter sp. M2B1 TaxID=3088895 RepID=UPI003D78C96D